MKSVFGILGFIIFFAVFIVFIVATLRSMERRSSTEIEGGTIFDSIEDAEEVRDIMNSRYIDTSNAL